MYAMDAREILTALYASDDVRECIAKLRPVHIQDDVRQHVFTELLLKNPDEIIGLYERGKLKQYVVKMIFNMVRWERSSFTKTLGKETPTEHFNDTPDEIPIDEISIPLDSLHWYDRAILELYAEHRSFRKIEQITGIEYSGLCKTIQRVRKQLKKQIDL